MSLHPQQLVTRADGSAVLAEQLKVGDELPGPDGPVEITEIKRWSCSEWCEVFLSNRVSLLISSDHYFRAGAEVRSFELQLGMSLKAIPKPVTVEGLVRIPQPAKAVDMGGVFYLQNILSGRE